jgi:hypothetical protein
MDKEIIQVAIKPERALLPKIENISLVKYRKQSLFLHH